MPVPVPVPVPGPVLVPVPVPGPVPMGAGTNVYIRYSTVYRLSAAFCAVFQLNSINSINYNREYPPPRAKSAAWLAHACMHPWGHCS